MTEPPTNGTPGEGARDWFAPNRPSGIPDDPHDITYSGPIPGSDITYSGPLPQPAAAPIPGRLQRPMRDKRVWPPEPEEARPDGEEGSTQPFPALRSTPLPTSQTGPLPAPAVPPHPEPAPPDEREPVDEAPANRGRRTALLGLGAVLSVAVAVGLPAWFGYGVYRYARPADEIQLVRPNGTGVWQHVSWRVSIEKTTDPSGRPATSDRQWMKVVVTRTALDGEGAMRHGSPEVRLTDDASRVWITLESSNETPPDTKDNKIGTPYRIEFLGVVPPSVADEVEVLLRPSSYRDVPGQSADDFFKAAVKEPPDNHVLRFTR